MGFDLAAAAASCRTWVDFEIVRPRDGTQKDARDVDCRGIYGDSLDLQGRDVWDAQGFMFTGVCHPYKRLL
eukprot:1159558-Pelagomonas_calceolata.AAC.3